MMGFGKQKQSVKKFSYVPPDDDTTRKRAQNKGGARDSFVRDDIGMFTPAEKVNRLRYLPWTGEERPHHYGMDIYVHYGIGPDNGAYLCLYKMYGEACPICEAKKRAEEEGDEDTAKSLKPTYRVLAYIINRAAEAEGPKLWAMPYTVDANICAVCVDEDTKDIAHIDNPDEGYDAFVTREGSGRNTKYSGEKIARNASPLHANEQTADTWLNFVIENPIEDVLVKRDYEYIANVFAGGVPAKKVKDEEVKKEAKTPASSLPKKGASKPAPVKEEPEEEEEQPTEELPEEEEGTEELEMPEMTWDGIHEASHEVLIAILVKEEVQESDYIEMTDTEIADAICDMYDLKKPEPKKMSLKDKIKNKKK